VSVELLRELAREAAQEAAASDGDALRMTEQSKVARAMADRLPAIVVAEVTDHLKNGDLAQAVADSIAQNPGVPVHDAVALAFAHLAPKLGEALAAHMGKLSATWEIGAAEARGRAIAQRRHEQALLARAGAVAEDVAPAARA